MIDVSSGDGRRPTLLAICTIAPWPVRDGYSLRVFNLLRELASQWTVTLLAPLGPDGTGLVAPEIADHIPIALNGPGLTYPWRFNQRELRAAVHHIVQTRRPHRALVWPGAEAAWFSQRNLPPAVMDMIDSNSLEFWRALLMSTDPRERFYNLREFCIATWCAYRTVRAFAATICVGERDAAWMARTGRHQTVHVVPNGVELPSETSLVEEVGHPTLCFTGTLNYAPNIDAVLFAAAEIWPRIRSAIPDASFVIAGRSPVPDIAALDGRAGIRVEADVTDMQSVIGRSWVSIAPMRVGAGIKNKVLEAWACARPVVMTPMATSGLALPSSHRALVHNDAAALAEAVIGLFMSPQDRRLSGISAQETVKRHHTWAGAARRLTDLLRDARVTGPGTSPV